MDNTINISNNHESDSIYKIAVIFLILLIVVVFN